MALPNIRVYIRPASSFVVGGTALLGTTALGAGFILGPPAGAFYELTTLVTSVSIRRGRTRVTDTFDAARASVTLIDRTAIFSPDNASSPLYVGGESYVKPLRQFRITATLNSVEYDLFNGYTNQYSYDYESGISAAQVTIEAVDAFRLLNLAEIDPSTWTSNIPVYGETSGARITKILTEIGVPNGLQSIETGDTSLDDDPFTQRSALEAVQQIEDTELGAFYIDSQGRFVFKSRHTVQQLASGAVIAPRMFNEAQITRVNLTTNPSFETNTTDWSSAQSSAVRSTDVAWSGNASYKVTMSSTTDSNVGATTITVPSTGVYTISAYVYVPSDSTIAGRTISIARESGTAVSSAVSSTDATLVAGQWARCSVTRNVTTAGTMVMVMRLSGDLRTARQRTNLCTNPSFETNTTGWATFNASNVRTAGTITGGVGSWSLVTTATATSVGGAYFGAFAATPGEPITATAYALRTSGSRTYRIGFEFYNGATFLSATNGTAQSCATATRLTVTGTVPATATNAYITLYSNTVGSIGDAIQLDAVLIEYTSGANSYFDGSTNTSTSWTGATNNSTSIYAAQNVYVDAVLAEQSSTAGVYIDGTLAPAIPFQGISQSLDDEQVYNDVSVTGGGSTSQVTDTTSIDTYFTRSLNKPDTLLLTATEATDYATFLLNFRKNPTFLFDSIALMPMALSTADAISCITAELLEPVSITKSYGADGLLSRTLTIQAIQHDITPNSWFMALSTAEPVSGDGFILDSATYGILDTNTLSF